MLMSEVRFGRRRQFPDLVLRQNYERPEVITIGGYYDVAKRKVPLARKYPKIIPRVMAHENLHTGLDRIGEMKASESLDDYRTFGYMDAIGPSGMRGFGAIKAGMKKLNR